MWPFGGLVSVTRRLPNKKWQMWPQDTEWRVTLWSGDCHPKMPLSQAEANLFRWAAYGVSKDATQGYCHVSYIHQTHVTVELGNTECNGSSPSCSGNYENNATHTYKYPGTFLMHTSGHMPYLWSTRLTCDPHSFFLALNPILAYRRLGLADKIWATRR